MATSIRRADLPKIDQTLLQDATGTMAACSSSSSGSRA